MGAGFTTEKNIIFVSELIMSGVAFHHAGLDIQDRKTVESMFTQGDVPVLCELHNSQICLLLDFVYFR